MRILHYYTASDRMTSEYVNILSSAMTELNYLSGDRIIDNVSATSLHDALKIMKDSHIDIVHFHGCWRNTDFIVARKAEKEGTRIVVSPHGELEPWIIKQDYWKSHLPRIIAYQRRIVRDAFSIIVMGRMEEECMKRLGWNMRIEVVKNSMITDTITEKDMAAQVLAIYNKVMDSHTFSLLDTEERMAFAALIKAGVTNDHRWLTDSEKASVSTLSSLAWRRIMVYAYHVSISDTIADAADALGIAHLDINPENIACYLPKTEKRKGLFNKEIKPLPAVIADDNGDYTDSFCKYVTALHRHASIDKMTIKDVVETASLMRRLSINERLFNEEMKAKGLDKFVASLMQIMSDYTNMEEGFMLMPPKAGARTRKLSVMIDDELNIK